MGNNNTNISLFGYTFTQTAMLLIRYGFDVEMPLYVTWFPSIILGISIIIIIIVLIIVFVIWLLSEIY